MGGQVAGTPLDSIAHVVQTALTPVFLFSGVATLLNVLSTRIGRVNDITLHVTELLDAAQPGEQARFLLRRLARLRLQNTVLITSIVLAALAGAATCSAILALFVGALRDQATAAVLFALFGVAIASTTGSLIAFLGETVLSWRGLRLEMARAREKHRPNV